MVFPLAAIAGLAQTGFGILSGLNSSAEQAYASAYNSASAAYNNQLQNKIQNLMIDAANRQRVDIYGKQVEQYNTQKGFNADAANRAYAAEQRRLNDVFTQAAYQRQGMLENLLQAQGYNNATEQYGNSARRANLVSTLGNFGRQQAILADSLAGARMQSRENMLEIGRQNLSADYQGWQGVAIPPSMEVGASTPSPLPPSSRTNGLNDALMIGNALMGGFNTFMNLKPPSAGSLSGFNYGNTRLGSGGGSVGGIGTFGPNYGFRR